MSGNISKKIVPIEKMQINIKIRSSIKEKMGEDIVPKLFMIQIKIPTRTSAKNFKPANVKTIECRSVIVNK
ncbi:hypothetical protein ES705_46673 [subsurface metagenome]